MAVEDLWVSRLAALIEKGKSLDVRYNAGAADAAFDGGTYNGWTSQVLAALTQLLGAEHVYTVRFRDEMGSGYWYEGEAAIEILRAVAEDLSNGHLFSDVRQLIAAEVFSDFLAMAEHLVENGYHQAAASLVGAVLEDGLRRIAAKNGKKNTGNLESLNDVCAQGGVYSALVQKQVKVWIGIRNLADHGNWSEFAKSDVETMSRDVTSFLATYG